MSILVPDRRFSVDIGDQVGQYDRRMAARHQKRAPCCSWAGMGSWPRARVSGELGLLLSRRAPACSPSATRVSPPPAPPSPALIVGEHCGVWAGVICADYHAGVRSFMGVWERMAGPKARKAGRSEAFESKLLSIPSPLCSLNIAPTHPAPRPPDAPWREESIGGSGTVLTKH